MEQSSIGKLANPVVQALLDEVIQLHGIGVIRQALCGITRAHACLVEEAPHGLFLKLFYKVSKPRAAKASSSRCTHDSPQATGASE